MVIDTLLGRAPATDAAVILLAVLLRGKSPRRGGGAAHRPAGFGTAASPRRAGVLDRALGSNLATRHSTSMVGSRAAGSVLVRTTTMVAV